jgi:hypothetical protein
MSSDETPRSSTREAVPSEKAPRLTPTSVRPSMAWSSDILPRSTAFISTLSIIVALAIVLVWAFIGIGHARDTYFLNHVSGHRMALARALAGGVLYPPLYDGRNYGGTRIMPLSILLHASAARVTGEYVMSGRLLSCFILLMLAVVVFRVLRDLQCPSSVAAILSAFVLITEPGYRVGFSALVADGLAVLLQLLAVSSVTAYRGRTGIVMSAALSALAFMTKFSALWAPMAVATWLTMRKRNGVWLFTSAYVVLVAILIGVAGVVSAGRFFENLFGLSLAGIDGISQALHSPTLLIRTMFGNTPALWALAPVAVLGLAFNLARGEASIYDISLICHIPLLFLIFADIGAGDNHLLDLAVLGVLVTGHASSFLSRGLDEGSAVPRQLRTHRLKVVQTVVVLFALWMTTTHLVVLVPDVYTAAAALTAGSHSNHRPLEHWITPRDTILSEDPYVPIALGQVPVVIDPFMLLRIGKRNPDAVRALMERIEAREFDFVILTAPIERTVWWERFHFGSDVIQAVDRSYDFSGGAEGYYLYTPAHLKGNAATGALR